MRTVVVQGLNPTGPEGECRLQHPTCVIYHAMRKHPLTAASGAASTLITNTIYSNASIDDWPSAGVDPLEFPAQAAQAQALRVRQAVADNIGWDKPAAPGVFRGLAQNHALQLCGRRAAKCPSTPGARGRSSIVAETDPGTAVNPAQIERRFRLLRVWAVACSMARSPSRTAWSSRRTSTPTT